MRLKLLIPTHVVVDEEEHVAIAGLLIGGIVVVVVTGLLAVAVVFARTRGEIHRVSPPGTAGFLDAQPQADATVLCDEAAHPLGGGGGQFDCHISESLTVNICVSAWTGFLFPVACIIIWGLLPPDQLQIMPTVRIKEALAGHPAIGTEITVRGWVRTRRDSKAGFSFINVHDGSCFDAIQVVAPAELDNYEHEVKKLTTGCAVICRGTLVESAGRVEGQVVVGARGEQPVGDGQMEVGNN